MSLGQRVENWRSSTSLMTGHRLVSLFARIVGPNVREIGHQNQLQCSTPPTGGAAATARQRQREALPEAKSPLQQRTASPAAAPETPVEGPRRPHAPPQAQNHQRRSLMAAKSCPDLLKAAAPKPPPAVRSASPDAAAPKAGTDKKRRQLRRADGRIISPCI